MNLKEELLKTIAKLDGLNKVEDLIRTKLSSDAHLLEEIPEYLLDLGGKRMRPVLCLMIAKALGNPVNEKLVQISAGIELIHMATLLHDDIIDNASLRRHKISPYKKYGTAATLLAGDFLLVRAFSLCAHLDEFIINETEKACIELTEGEILETPFYKQRHDLNSYLTIADKKTASLFKLATISAAHLSDCNPETVKTHREFGINIGIAFQILDDILDITSNKNLLGKEIGTDLKEKKPSIINVLWLDSNSDLAKEVLLKEEQVSPENLKLAIEEIKNSEIIEKSKQLATKYANQSLDNLATIKNNKLVKDEFAFSSLHKIVQYTLSRLG
ncbi:UNVERIFIED_CONTAM: hypothetical protein GTU68_050048 [Idotea baltica]|nr:hypothetical protein [Idotea baltica]